VRIGSAVTLAHLAAAPRLAALLPALVEAALAVAGPSHRNAATLGGNLCLDTRCVYYNQSEWWRESNGLCLKYGGTLCHVAPTGKRCHAAFSGDLAPVLLALEASAELEGPEGTRHVPLEAFYIEDGAAPLALGPDEMLVAVDVPLAAARRAAYEKVRQRGAIDFPLAGVAVALERSGDRLGALNVAVTGTNSRPILIAGTDELVGMPLDEEAVRRLGKLVQQQVSPMRTTLAPAHYRRRVAAALAARLARRLYAAESEAEG
jgi:4-hydroxybenzoyl-CoA reductase subunit beta